MSVSIKPTFQIQRINELENRLIQIKEQSIEKMIQRPNPKSWSAIEVAKHMVLGHNMYQTKLTEAFKGSASSEEIHSEYKASTIPSFLIKRFPPKEGVIKFKMKTTKMFKPVLDVDQLDAAEIQAILEELGATLKELKSWVEVYRTKAISMKKFNSALGAVVRFTIPEACEFILCHNERHFLQLERALVN